MMLVDDSDEPLPLRFIVRICTCPHSHMIELSLLRLSVMERFYLNLQHFQMPPWKDRGEASRGVCYLQWRASGRQGSSDL